MTIKQKKLLQINFTLGASDEVVEHCMKKRGLIVVPSAPVLVAMESDPELRKSLVSADSAILDSGFLSLLWWLFDRQLLPKLSGFKYLTCLLQKLATTKEQNIFWVMPSLKSAQKNLQWLNAYGHETKLSNCYVAPLYPAGRIEDSVLLATVNAHQPEHIIIAIGGGTQERLGLYLRENLRYRPVIHCIGAAIGFLSGDQIKMPIWADRLYLGWLVRIIGSPRIFLPRYLRALKLFLLVWRFKRKG